MQINMDVKGLKGLNNKLNYLKNNLSKDVTAKAIIVGSLLVESDAKKNISNAKDVAADKWSRTAHGMTGRQKLSGRKLKVGEGNLRATINHDISVNYIKGTVEGSVGANKVYARIHELGGYAGPGRKVLIPARPYLLPALLKNVKKVKDMLKENFWKLVGKARTMK